MESNDAVASESAVVAELQNNTARDGGRQNFEGTKIAISHLE